MGAFTFALSDSVSLSDAQLLAEGYKPTDTLTLLDGLNLISPEIAFVLRSDAYFISDSLTVNLQTVTFETVSDTVSLSDTIALKIARQVLLTDRIQLLDDVVNEINQGLTIFIGDTFNFNDRLGSSNTNTPSVSDTLSLTDSPRLSRTFSFTADAVSLTDGAVTDLASIFLNLTETPIDSITFFDSVDFSGPDIFSIGDTFQFGESVGVTLHSFGNSYLRRYLNDV